MSARRDSLDSDTTSVSERSSGGQAQYPDTSDTSPMRKGVRSSSASFRRSPRAWPGRQNDSRVQPIPFSNRQKQPLYAGESDLESTISRYWIVVDHLGTGGLNPSNSSRRDPWGRWGRSCRDKATGARHSHTCENLEKEALGIFWEALTEAAPQLRTSTLPTNRDGHFLLTEAALKLLTRREEAKRRPQLSSCDTWEHTSLEPSEGTQGVPDQRGEGARKGKEGEQSIDEYVEVSGIGEEREGEGARELSGSSPTVNDSRGMFRRLRSLSLPSFVGNWRSAKSRRSQSRHRHHSQEDNCLEHVYPRVRTTSRRRRRNSFAPLLANVNRPSSTSRGPILWSRSPGTFDRHRSPPLNSKEHSGFSGAFLGMYTAPSLRFQKAEAKSPKTRNKLQKRRPPSISSMATVESKSSYERISRRSQRHSHRRFRMPTSFLRRSRRQGSKVIPQSTRDQGAAPGSTACRSSRGRGRWPQSLREGGRPRNLPKGILSNVSAPRGSAVPTASRKRSQRDDQSFRSPPSSNYVSTGTQTGKKVVSFAEPPRAPPQERSYGDSYRRSSPPQTASWRQETQWPLRGSRIATDRSDLDHDYSSRAARTALYAPRPSSTKFAGDFVSRNHSRRPISQRHPLSRRTSGSISHRSNISKFDTLRRDYRLARYRNRPSYIVAGPRSERRVF